MIIELSEYFATLDEQGWLPYRQALRNCLIAHQQGWHIFVPSRQVASNILALGILEESERALLEFEITSRASTLIGQARSSKFTLLCKAGFKDGSHPSDRHICVEFEAFSKLDNLLPSRLLVEDAINDGRFIQELAIIAAEDLGYHGPLCLEVVHGGGGGMDRLYQGAHQDIRPMICVADSDKRFRDDRFGDTARKLLAVGSENLSGTVRLVIWPCRELENVVPISFLFDVFANDGLVRQRVASHHHFINSNDRCIVDRVTPFTDLKNGVSTAEIQKYPAELREVFQIMISSCDGLNVDGVAGISQNLIPMTLRLLEIEPRYRAKFRLKFRKMPDFPVFGAVLSLVISFGASLGRIPHRLPA